MSDAKSHEALVGQQFGSRASAYLTSAVHAQGADLQTLAEMIDDKAGARVLDLGCGGGHVSFHAARRAAEVVAYDLSSDMLEVVANAAADRGLTNIVTRQGVAEELPFADQSFDCVLSRYSTHHWRDFPAGLREIRRVLKSGGHFGVVDGISPGVPLFDTYLQGLELLRDPSHVRNYSIAEWTAALVAAGLKPQAVTTDHVRLEFTSWVERMRTPKVQVDAIRALQQAMSENVARYFDLGADGSFNLETALIKASKPA
ncbi:methyltransferase domain-containing protein [Chelatococcus sp. GCM10030263]|uniref:class I SAM-dependent methyltransferase n=1 Tax=Chelatococcus sp. GCM10030263 TaxID=3273387 RepID=UPI0036185269